MHDRLSTPWPNKPVQPLEKSDILVNNAGWNIPAAIDQLRDDDGQYLQWACQIRIGFRCTSPLHLVPPTLSPPTLSPPS